MSETIETAPPPVVTPAAETLVVTTPTSTPPVVQAAAPEPTSAESVQAEPSPAPGGQTEAGAGEGAAPEVRSGDAPTLLETAGTPKAADAEPAPKEAPAPAAPAAEAPTVYESFTMPDGITANPEQLAAYQEIAGQHRLDQATAQRLLDMHTGTLKQYAENLAAEQQRVWRETRAAWVAQVHADAELGGPAMDTTMKAIARARDMLVPPERMPAFEKMLRETGVGDHPEFLKVLLQAARKLDEPAVPPPNAAPTRDGGGRGRGDFQATMYTHPSSLQIMNGGP